MTEQLNWTEWQPCMQDSKRDTDVLNSLLDPGGEGEGVMIWEKGIETCKLSYVSYNIYLEKKITSLLVDNIGSTQVVKYLKCDQF